MLFRNDTNARLFQLWQNVLRQTAGLHLQRRPKAFGNELHLSRGGIAVQRQRVRARLECLHRLVDRLAEDDVSIHQG